MLKLLYILIFAHSCLKEQYQVDIEEKSEKNKKIVNLSARDVDTDADLEINIDWTQTIATRRGAKLQSNELYKE